MITTFINLSRLFGPASKQVTVAHIAINWKSSRKVGQGAVGGSNGPHAREQLNELTFVVCPITFPLEKEGTEVKLGARFAIGELSGIAEKLRDCALAKRRDYVSQNLAGVVLAFLVGEESATRPVVLSQLGQQTFAHIVLLLGAGRRRNT